MAARSYVITSRKRLDEFLREGDRLNRIELRVGILSGKPRYPKGWVGKKSRDQDRAPTRRVDPSELQRRAAIRSLRSQIGKLDPKARKQAVKEIRQAFRGRGISTRGLTRSRSSKGTAAAKVAGVLHAGSAYHVVALNARRAHLARELEEIMRALHAGRKPTELIRGIGKRSRDAVRTQIVKEGHIDSRRLWKTTQFEITDLKGKIYHQRVARAKRAAARKARAARRKR